jgi:L-lactate dehydrogenase
MKIGIIGSGMVGGAIANALAHSGRRLDIVLTDKDHGIAQAQALDINSGLRARTAVRAGTLEDLRDAHVVVFAAGKRAQGAWGSSELLKLNAPILDQTLPQVMALAPNATVVIAAHPMDLLTNHAAKLLGKEHATQVIGSGTMLETNLLRQTLGQALGVHPRSVHGYVLGEESGSALVAWSSVRVAGVGLDEFLASRGESLHYQDKSGIADRVKRAVSGATSAKGAFLFGIGAVIAQLVTAILEDTREVLTVSAWDESSGCALSLPRVIGRGGVLQTLEPPLDADERARFEVIQGYFRTANAN